jgi:hypothetical protein
MGGGGSDFLGSFDLLLDESGTGVAKPDQRTPVDP